MQIKKKDVLAENVCFSAGYHKAEYISAGAVKLGYCAGVTGWNCDIFAGPALTGAALVTGCRPFGYSSEATCDIINQYNQTARRLPRNDYRQYINAASALFNAMMVELVKVWRHETQKN